MATKTPAPAISAPKRIPLDLLARVERVRERSEKAAGMPVDEGAALRTIIETGLVTLEKKHGIR